MAPIFAGACRTNYRIDRYAMPWFRCQRVYPRRSSGLSTLGNNIQHGRRKSVAMVEQAIPAAFHVA